MKEPQPTGPWPIESWPTESLAKSAKARAASAKAREIDAHRRAITMQEDAAKFFDRIQEPDLSASARVRADNARELLRRALEEQAEMGTESS